MAGAALCFPSRWTGDAVESPLKDFKFTAVALPAGAHRQPHPVCGLHAAPGAHGVAPFAICGRRARSQHFGPCLSVGCLCHGNHPNALPAICLGRLGPHRWPPGIPGHQVQPGRNGMGAARPRSFGRGAAWDCAGEDSVFIQGDPEDAALLAPQASHRFGVTRITAFEGGIDRRVLRLSRRDGSAGNGLPARFQSARALE